MTGTKASGSPSPEAPDGSAEPSRAGSLAGEGRERPGRAETSAPADEDGDAEEEDSGYVEEDDDGSSPDATESVQASETPGLAARPPATPLGRPAHRPVTHAEAPTEPVLRILPLGSGLVLIGLGLGLAFAGLRLRRG
ncbi:hypothetical protein [Streptomyces pseudovenezuelae]|uniref:Uncharacterized protein n=1 Tax=Streptomyces pseudovenezuelae TaxID=67350 RepID=A0ABT6LGA3_9ACTN|nr:hypothetical protein [Streptomyces pseudovenezuelae]MDH6214990.1 hypothetical protein [Streptomyces pseudovenezuelae]